MPELVYAYLCGVCVSRIINISNQPRHQAHVSVVIDGTAAF